MEPLVLIVGVFVVAAGVIWRRRERTDRAIADPGLRGFSQRLPDDPRGGNAGHGSLRDHGRPRERGN